MRTTVLLCSLRCAGPSLAHLAFRLASVPSCVCVILQSARCVPMSGSARPASPTAEQQADAKKPKLDSQADDMAAASAAKYTLYSYWRSGASWRVRIALQHKKIPYTYSAINLLAGEQTKGEYAAKNPQLKVPLLSFNDGSNKSISQSVAIIDYLEQTHKDAPSLMPKDPYLRAKALSLAEGLNADTQPLQNLHVLNRIESITNAKAKMEWAAWCIDKGLRAFEADVQQTAGTYCVGDEVSIADVFLIPQLAGARRFNVDLTPFPTLTRIETKLQQLPAFQAAHPDQQPDKPKE